MSNTLPMDGSHMGVFTHVEAGHRAVEALLSQIERTPPDLRGELFAQLVPMLVAHEVAEEEVLYPALRVVTDQVEPTIQARLAEQSEAEELLQQLEDLDPASAEFGSTFTRLSVAVRVHAAAEEHEVLPLIAELEQALDRPGLGARYEQAKRVAPTHPHPHAPDRPPGNLLLGPVAALVDRVRDALR